MELNARRSAKAIYRRSDALDYPDDRSWADVCLRDRQDQLDRLKAQDVAGVVLWLRNLVYPLPVDAADNDEPPLRRHRTLGRQRARRVGRRHSQLRLVDRNRSRRNLDFGDSAVAATTLAHVDQSLR